MSSDKSNDRLGLGTAARRSLSEDGGEWVFDTVSSLIQNGLHYQAANNDILDHHGNKGSLRLPAECDPTLINLRFFHFIHRKRL